MDSSNLAGTQLGKYQLHAEIGRGGMGAVYKAYDPTLDRFVAVKVLAPHLVWEKEFIERFLREARAAARLRHPSIVTIYDVGQEGNWYYFAMEYLEGQTLAQFIRQRGPMSAEETLHILRPLAEGLDYAHGQGLVHRDVKPGNVIVGPGEHATLTDFGIARAAQETRLTRTGAIVGTPEYMSPEQAQGGGVSTRSDQYALGVVAYEMLAGRVPFQAESTAALLHKVVYEPPPPLRKTRPGLPVEVERVLERALAKEPVKRYRSCGEFVSALEKAALLPRPARPVPAPRPTPPVPAPPPKRTWLWMGIAGILLIGLCAVALGGTLALPALFGGTATVQPTSPPPPTVGPTVSPLKTTEPTSPPPTEPVEPPSPTPPQPSPTLPPTVEPTVDTSLRWSTIGQSVRGRDLEVAIMGDTSGVAVVVVGSIQGDQPNTRDLINYLIDDFNHDRGRIPASVAFHFIPTINPDGNAAGTRRNAHDVDLNRNWDTFDWTANPEQPGGTVRGAGGSRPLSEPETQSLADYLLSLQRQNPDLRLVLYHSSQRISSGGHVYPGYTSSGLDRDALSLAWRYADVIGYAVKEDWAPYETEGELITWCAEEGIEAIDIVIPGSLSGSNSSLRNTTMEALLEIARFP